MYVKLGKPAGGGVAGCRSCGGRQGGLGFGSLLTDITGAASASVQLTQLGGCVVSGNMRCLFDSLVAHASVTIGAEELLSRIPSLTLDGFLQLLGYTGYGAITAAVSPVWGRFQAWAGGQVEVGAEAEVETAVPPADAVVEQHDRPASEGGGTVYLLTSGASCLACLPNSGFGPTVVGPADMACPPGFGGVPGAQAAPRTLVFTRKLGIEWVSRMPLPVATTQDDATVRDTVVKTEEPKPWYASPLGLGGGCGGGAWCWWIRGVPVHQEGVAESP